jgi:hypothetical protein
VTNPSDHREEITRRRRIENSNQRRRRRISPVQQQRSIYQKAQRGSTKISFVFSLEPSGISKNLLAFSLKIIIEGSECEVNGESKWNLQKMQ